MKKEITNRIPSLDGLRAISIIFVLIAHLTGTRFFPIVVDDPLNLGNFGVRVFFIISGFLITGILLRELAKTDTINLKKFYFRRTLRIFPPYYAFLFVIGLLAVLNFNNVRFPEWFGAVAYISNFVPVNSWLVVILGRLPSKNNFTC